MHLYMYMKFIDSTRYNLRLKYLSCRKRYFPFALVFKRSDKKYCILFNLEETQPTRCNVKNPKCEEDVLLLNVQGHKMVCPVVRIKLLLYINSFLLVFVRSSILIRIGQKKHQSNSDDEPLPVLKGFISCYFHVLILLRIKYTVNRFLVSKMKNCPNLMIPCNLYNIEIVLENNLQESNFEIHEG